MRMCFVLFCILNDETVHGTQKALNIYVLV